MFAIVHTGTCTLFFPQKCCLLLIMNLCAVFEITFEFTGQKTSKLEYLYRLYAKILAKVTGPNQFPLAVGHRTTAKVDDCMWKSSMFRLN